ncbi:hypothetical protein V1280_001833 [Bradyrhizobium sp. AZCC 2230]
MDVSRKAISRAYATASQWKLIFGTGKSWVDGVTCLPQLEEKANAQIGIYWREQCSRI